MLHDPKHEAMFPRLPVEKIREMCQHGTEREFADGEMIFSEGQANYPFFLVLEGRVRVTKRAPAGEMLLTIHEPGQFAGEISMLTGAPAIATGKAEGPARLAIFSPDEFRLLLAECPDLATIVLRAFAARAREVDATIVQQEKLASLGKMAAGLAHELNNPAAAMVRTVQSLESAVSRVSSLGMQYDCRFDLADRPILDHIQHHVREAATDPETLSPLERSDREEALAAWMEENGMENGWDMAPGLVNAGLTRECVQSISGKLKPDALTAALTWLEADLTTNQLAKELESASARISDLVLAMKQYTYMDQAQFQEIDIHAGLDSTLKIFHHKTKKGIEVRRDYDRSLPKIKAYAGELNQVWTNLIDNAIDAMNGKGVLTVSTRREGPEIVVTIGDNGPGIPEEIRERMFEPFVTTKPAGKGTGLGLEIARRIVVNRHLGRIRAESVPGDTRFVVTLPIEHASSGEETHEMYSSRSDSEREAAYSRV
ncbi:MAG: cyclic nucleotide-binding domain-containing protein [Acidobacteriota bacterium]|nr:cyclic nucleotide-binding domain-containing protein [Acidobacteriota bacterium]